jgi:large subunit ribosomal protein L10
MGRTRESKEVVVADLKQTLSESQLAFVIDYKGLSVAEITDLRNRIRPKGAVCTVTKNTLMGIAIKGDEKWQAMEGLLQNSSAFVLIKDDIGGTIKAYKQFQKDTKKTELCGGVMEGRALTKEQVEAIGDLPSKEQLMAQIAGALNSITAKIAIGIKEVPSSIARGIKAYAEKDGDNGAE